MTSRKFFLAAALCLPLLGLGALVARNHFLYASGEEVILPIKGYDPRDLLAGHYLRYKINYGIDNPCEDKKRKKGTDTFYLQGPAIICLKPRSFTLGDEPPEACSLFIRGICSYSAGFEAGIERYYIPQHLALKLEKKARGDNASIVLSVTREGNAMIKDLLFDGKSWRTP